MSEIKNSNGAWKIAGFLICTLITIITTLSLFITTGLRGDIKKIDNKIFIHLTNHEIHIPRAQVVSKAIFDMHCYVSDNKIEKLIEEINK